MSSVENVSPVYVPAAPNVVSTVAVPQVQTSGSSGWGKAITASALTALAAWGLYIISRGKAGKSISKVVGDSSKEAAVMYKGKIATIGEDISKIGKKSPKKAISKVENILEQLKELKPDVEISGSIGSKFKKYQKLIKELEKYKKDANLTKKQEKSIKKLIKTAKKDMRSEAKTIVQDFKENGVTGNIKSKDLSACAEALKGASGKTKKLAKWANKAAKAKSELAAKEKEISKIGKKLEKEEANIEKLKKKKKAAAKKLKKATKGLDESQIATQKQAFKDAKTQLKNATQSALSKSEISPIVGDLTRLEADLGNACSGNKKLAELFSKLQKSINKNDFAEAQKIVAKMKKADVSAAETAINNYSDTLNKLVDKLGSDTNIQTARTALEEARRKGGRITKFEEILDKRKEQLEKAKERKADLKKAKKAAAKKHKVGETYKALDEKGEEVIDTTAEKDTLSLKKLKKILAKLGIE